MKIEDLKFGDIFDYKYGEDEDLYTCICIDNHDSDEIGVIDIVSNDNKDYRVPNAYRLKAETGITIIRIHDFKVPNLLQPIYDHHPEWFI